jgi:metal-dependent amidase/aminoacylase/carboxypeptidase family protein
MVVGDPSFSAVRPDIALAVHNLPGFDLGHVVMRTGPYACASRGLVIGLRGATSHAAQPEHGRSPALAVAQVIESWTAARQLFTGLDESVQATVIHAAVGHPAFGTSPGDGHVMATLRAASDELIDTMDSRLRFVAQRIAEAYELEFSFTNEELFPATVNDPEVAGVVVETARSLGRVLEEPAVPFAWSEDFGHFGNICPSALIGLGAGRSVPALHHPAYDFPDELIPQGVALIEATARHWLDDHG